MMRAIVGLVALATLAACGHDRSGPVEEDYPGVRTSALPGGVNAQPGTIAEFEAMAGDRVFFEVDRSTLSSEAVVTLGAQAGWLVDYPQFTVTIEGHTDERGTREYNLALGVRRAEAVRTYLVSRGVEADRIRTITYGKERPAEICSNESCWSENRRAVTILAGAAAG